MEHHVYFWLKDEHLTDTDRATFEAGLADLFKISSVAGGIWGKPAPTMERPVIDSSWHYATSMRFDSAEKQDAYQVDPDHEVFVNKFKDWWRKVEVRDVMPL